MSDIKQIFTDIYNTKIWGKGGSEHPFYSGGGSHNSKIIIPYIDLVSNLIKEMNITTICDIGCGDFNIMNSVLQTYSYVKYYGVDVVDELIQYNNNIYGSDQIQFICMDASDVSQVLPQADLLIIRQVLQHLDNDHITMILKRAEKYRFVLVTEHLPKIPLGGFNRNKPTNNKIRLNRGSGVYIERKPFNYSCKHVLNIDMGILSKIRTSLIINNI